jgi:hypothetical protein
MTKVRVTVSELRRIVFFYRTTSDIILYSEPWLNHYCLRQEALLFFAVIADIIRVLSTNMEVRRGFSRVEGLSPHFMLLQHLGLRHILSYIWKNEGDRLYRVHIRCSRKTERVTSLDSDFFATNRQRKLERNMRNYEPFPRKGWIFSGSMPLL